MAQIDSTVRDRFKDALVNGDPTPAVKEWDEVAFRAGLGVQQAELNEMQSVINYYMKNLGVTQLTEGAFVSGAGLSQIDEGTREITIADGVFFFNGKVRRVLGAKLVIPNDFTKHILGLIFQPPQVIDEIGNTVVPGFVDPSVADTTLVDPVTLPNNGLPGAMRVRIYATWAIDDATARSVWEIPAPIVSEFTGVITQPPPILLAPIGLDLKLSELEKRTYEWFGQFKLSGFTGAFDCTNKYEAPVTRIQTAAAVSDGQIFVVERRPFQPSQELAIGMGLQDQELKFIADTYIPQTGPGAIPLAGQLASAHVVGEVVGIRDATQLSLQMGGGVAYVNGVRVQVDSPAPIKFPKALDALSRTQGLTVVEDPPRIYGLSPTIPPVATDVLNVEDQTAVHALSGGAVSTVAGSPPTPAQVWVQPQDLVYNGTGQPFSPLGGTVRRTQFLCAVGLVGATDLLEKSGALSPEDIKVTGIEVHVRKRIFQPAPVRDYAIHLYSNNTVIGGTENKAATDQNWPDQDFVDSVYGGPHDLWGLPDSDGLIGGALGYNALTGSAKVPQIGVAVAANLLGIDNNSDQPSSLCVITSIRLVVYYKTRNDSAFTYQLDQPFVQAIDRIDVNVLSPMMTFVKAGAVQNLPAVASVARGTAPGALLTDPVAVDWAARVLPNPTNPGAGALYSVLTYGVDANGDANPLLTLATAFGTSVDVPAGVLSGAIDNDPGGTAYIEGTDFTRSGDSVTWITGPVDGTVLFGRWVYTTDNGQAAAMRVGGRVQTPITNALGTMPASFNPALDVAVPITDTSSNPIKDVFSIVSITDSSHTVYTNGIDYFLDSGRRDNEITQARVIWRGSGVRPGVGINFNVSLMYWSSAGLIEGDFIAAGSYFESDGRTVITDRTILRLSDENAWFGNPPDVTHPNQNLTQLRLTVDIADSVDFRVNGRRPIAVTGSNVMIVEYTYFLPRMDVVALDSTGNIKLLVGDSAAAAQLPAIPDNFLPLIYISSDPGSDCPKVREAPSTMFTIPDIVNMIRRLENLETSTLASLLEQRGEAASSNMIKRGIFSDSFNDFSRADTAFAKTANANLTYDEGGKQVVFNCAISPLAQTLRLPFGLTPTQLAVDPVSTIGMYLGGSQVTLLSFTEAVQLTQTEATRVQRVNPTNALPPPMVVDLTPAFDFWVDDTQTPEQTIPLSHLESRQNATPTAQFQPVTSRTQNQPTAPLQSSVYRWWNSFHSGQPQSKTDLPLEFAPTSQNEVFTDGSTARAVPTATANIISKPSAPPIGFVDRSGRQRQRSSTQTINQTVISRDVIPFIRQQTVTCSGQLFPPSREVSATFDGTPIPLVPAIGTLAGTTPGTVLAAIDGTFLASFTIPANKFTGSPQVTFTSSVARKPQGPRNPTDVAQIALGGDKTWHNPGDVLDTDDTTFGFVALPGNSTSQVLLVKDFGFTIPAGSTVVGITARLVRRQQGGLDSHGNPIGNHGPLTDASIQLWKGPTFTAPLGTNLAHTDVWRPGPFVEAVYGGNNNLWGGVWSPDDINNNLALGIQVTNSGILASAQLATVEMTVYFLAADGTVREVTSSIAYVARGQLQTSTATYSSASTLPLAAGRADGAVGQSFTLTSDQWITSVDLYFNTKPADVAASDNQPPGVEVQVRNALPDGSPGAQVLGRTVLTQPQITAAADQLNRTTFVFTDPVLVRQNVPHTLVVCTDSDEYSLWVADLGQRTLSGTVVSKDPVAGNLWVSYDGATWRPSGPTDLSFVLRTAKLTTGQTGTLQFKPVTISANSGSALSLLAQVIAPSNSTIQWQVSLNSGTNWIPVQPGIDLTAAETFTSVLVRAILSLNLSGGAVPTASAGINLQTCGLLTYANSGTVEGAETAGDYVSLNYPIETTFDETRVVTDEFVPDSTTLIPFISANDGREWMRFDTEVSRIDLDNGVQEVTRRLNVQAWVAGQPHVIGDIVTASRAILQSIPNVGLGHVFKCVQAGTSDIVEPGDTGSASAWLTGAQQITVDGTAQWQEVGTWPFTQFRVRLRLATTDVSVTPQVANLILLALGNPGLAGSYNNPSPSGSLLI